MESISVENAISQVQIVLDSQKLTKQEHTFLDMCMKVIVESIAKKA